MISKFIFPILFSSLYISAGVQVPRTDDQDDLISAQEVADSFVTLSNHTTFYATGRAPLILDGVRKALKVNVNITLLGYALTYEGYTIDEQANLTSEMVEIYDHLYEIQEDFDWYYSHLLASPNHEACYDPLVED